MSSLAAKRVSKELLEFSKDHSSHDLYFLGLREDGSSVGSSSTAASKSTAASMMDLVAWISGPKDSPYENGKFELVINVPKSYPFDPPKVHFKTRVWHPNVSSVTGTICLDVLKDQWAASMSLRTILLSLISLLQNPVPDDPQDGVVAAQVLNNKDLYERTAAFWTREFAMSQDEKLKSKGKFQVQEDLIAKLKQALAAAGKVASRELVIVLLSNSDWDLNRAIAKA